MFLDFLLTFLVCGIFCLIAQIILDNTKLTPGHVTSMFVVIGAVLEFLNIYEYLRKFAKMGASMPIASFGSVIMKGVKEGVDYYGFLGIFSGVFEKSGSLIALAIFLAFISTLFFKPKS